MNLRILTFVPYINYLNKIPWKRKKLTSANGRLIADNQNTQTAGQRGPIMMQDPWFLENLHTLIVK